MATDCVSEMIIKQDSNNNLISKLRKQVRSYIDLHMYSSALFWADKVASLSDNEPQDVYWLAQCMFLMKQYHRAATLIKNRGLDKTHPLCLYLASKCYLEAHEFNDALQMLTGESEDQLGRSTKVSAISFSQLNMENNIEGFTTVNLQSSLLFLKGQIYEALDNRSVAAECFKQALQTDVHCFDAFNALVQHQMLSEEEEKKLLTTLPFSEQCGEDKFVSVIYEHLLKKYQSVPINSTPPLPHPRLNNNLDLAVAQAERYYYACNYKQCFNITEDVLKKDPYHTTCLPVHIACLVELKKVNKLFYLAHILVDLHPDNGVSWFAVGCYYYLIGKSDPARRYLGKATTLDKLFGPAWLTYGHSFAADNEHDQAMAAYFKASQLMKGCHLPLLYIGLECGLTNNITLAEKFFLQAQSISPQDPFVIHEMGVVAFQNQDYVTAESHFQKALTRVREINETLIAGKWEALLNNLGHTCRKLKKYDEALEYHQQALLLSPHNSSTLSCIGFVQALLGNLHEAIEIFHKALGQKRDDSFSTTMLNYVMEQLMEESPPVLDDSDEPAADLGETSSTAQPVTGNEGLSTLTEGNEDKSQLSFEVEMQDSFRDETNS
uniref:Cell division cycle protein 16 homolog n=1 Tax=Clastoptera arizonana TaxID=38151 RepID=A0A1B6CSF2_9HEMI